MILRCEACKDDAGERFPTGHGWICIWCYAELYHGIIMPNDVMLIDEDSCDEDQSDDEVAYLENAVRALEDGRE
jgi:hypothetical protein